MDGDDFSQGKGTKLSALERGLEDLSSILDMLF